MSTQKKSLGNGCFTFIIFETSRYLGRVVLKEDKVIKALEKKSIKEWRQAFTIKTQWSSQEFEAYCNKTARRHRGNVGDPASASKGLLQAQRKTVETIAKWSERLNLSKSKAVGTRF